MIPKLDLDNEYIAAVMPALLRAAAKGSRK